MKIIKLQGQYEKQKGIYYEYDAHSTPLGEGGMGIVYYGHCIEEKTGNSKEVAIKALHPNLPLEVYTRAEREASIRIKHDNLVEMLGFISVLETNHLAESSYRHYVISEYLNGIELSDLLVGRFDGIKNSNGEFARDLYHKYIKDKEATSLYIIRNILSGVLALHDKGYIHRDIDPGNIMVTSDGCIKLIDFGIAKKLNSLGTNDKLMTATGIFIGKAEYASPELVLGDVKNQNCTTDIYALGILFYRLLVGRLPFDGTQYEVLECQKKKKVPVKHIRNKEYAKIVRKATEKLQNRRYSSIAEFRVAIDAAEKHRPNIFVNACKYAAIVVTIIAIGFGIKQIINYPSVPAPSNRFQLHEALANIDSSNPDSVKTAFEQLKVMADNGNDTAKVEVGITYFSNPKNKIITHRRNLLGKDTGDERLPAELGLVIKYISSIEDKNVVTPEAYYILGLAYYFRNDTSNALSSFEKSLALVNLNVNAAHGYNNTELKTVLEENIEVLKQ